MNYFEMLQNWGNAQDAFHVLQAEADAPDAWEATLQAAQVTPAPLAQIKVSQIPGDHRIRLLCQENVPVELARSAVATPDLVTSLRQAAGAIEAARTGMMICRFHLGDDPPFFQIATVIYQDGFSRHTLNALVFEIAKAYRALQQSCEEFVPVAEPNESSDCPACGWANPTASRFCNQCGHRLQNE